MPALTAEVSSAFGLGGKRGQEKKNRAVLLAGSRSFCRKEKSLRDDNAAPLTRNDTHQPHSQNLAVSIALHTYQGSLLRRLPILPILLSSKSGEI